jgi:phosphoribosylanthranilate isomerase
MTRVKICGLSTEASLLASLDAGADLVGLVFFAKSPRNVSIEQAVGLADLARGRADIVALVVDPDDATLAKLAQDVKPDLFQLHGKETPERVAAIRTRFGIPVMKAIAVETAVDAAAARAYRDAADHILFDAKAPKGADLPGGNGVAFDWRALAAVPSDVSWMLSGGLTPETVAAAIRQTGAKSVDVSSGVERAPGVKDAARIARFIAAVRSA